MRINALHDSTDKVVIIICRDKEGRVLAGESLNTDQRYGMIVFPGGRMKSGESIQEAAIRECKEETGITCIPYHVPYRDGNMLVVLAQRDSGEPTPNHEFKNVCWMNEQDLYKSNVLSYNLDLIRRYN